jgi:hypothetical protein
MTGLQPEPKATVKLRRVTPVAAKVVVPLMDSSRSQQNLLSRAQIANLLHQIGCRTCSTVPQLTDLDDAALHDYALHHHIAQCTKDMRLLGSILQARYGLTVTRSLFTRYRELLGAQRLRNSSFISHSNALFKFNDSQRHGHKFDRLCTEVVSLECTKSTYQGFARLVMESAQEICLEGKFLCDDGDGSLELSYLSSLLDNYSLQCRELGDALSSVVAEGRLLRSPDSPLLHHDAPRQTGDVLPRVVSEKTRLRYHLSREDMQKPLDDRKATSGGQLFWSHKYYRDKYNLQPSVITCTTKDAADEALSLLLDEKVLGLDFEWLERARPKDGIKANMSLVQIASESCIILIQIARFSGATVEKLLPTNLKKLLEDPSITKAGVCIRADCTRLEKYLGVRTRGMFELSHLYKLVKHSQGPQEDARHINKRAVNLAQQVEEHLGLPLDKDLDIRTSRWNMPLSSKQEEYAADDAYCCHRLYHVLEEKRKLIRPTPPRPKHVEDDYPIMLADGHTVQSFCKLHKIDLNGPKIPKTLATDAEG